MRLPASPTFYYSMSAGCILLTLLHIVFTHHPHPVWDQFDYLPLLDLHFAGTLSWMDWLEPHGGHWHSGAYALMLPLALTSDWSLLLEAFISFLFVLAGFYLLHRALSQQYRDIAAPLTCLTAFFLFSLDQSGNWIWGWQLSLYMNVFGAIAMIILLTHPSLTLWYVLGAFLGAAIAIYNFTTGLALLPIGFLLLLLHPKRRHIFTVLWSLGAIAIIYHYYSAIYLTSPNAKLANNSRLDFIWHVFVFTINYLASPITRFAKDLAFLFTFISLVITYLSINLIIKQKQFSAYLPWLAFMAYGAGAAVLTSFGRIEWGTDQAFVSRYITLGNFYWIGLAMLSIPLFRELTGHKKQLLIGFSVIVILMKAGNSMQVVGKNLKNVAKDKATWEEIKTTWPDTPDETLAKLYWWPDKARTHISVMYENKLNIFAD